MCICICVFVYMYIHTLGCRIFFMSESILFSNKINQMLCWFATSRSYLGLCMVAQISKEFACNAGDPGLIPRLGKSPGEGNGYPFQYSCLENSVCRGAWGAIVHGVAKSGT